MLLMHIRVMVSIMNIEQKLCLILSRIQQLTHYITNNLFNVVTPAIKVMGHASFRQTRYI
jgi:hypothetical protein